NKFFTFCEEDKVKVFREFGDVREWHKEQQMALVDKSKLKQSQYAEKITNKDYNGIDEFFSTHEAPAWNPLHLETGPYYVIKRDDKIVSAAGTHFLTPSIGQIGNVTTDKNYRRQGFASMCCSAVASEIISRTAVVSLFVETENNAAMWMYKNLGFRKVRDIPFIMLEKH
ncbi:GNAT family N-acetyltransferase, partial [archaeon]|nr:GNAT family N-acetyltransferase [archaeon]